MNNKERKINSRASYIFDFRTHLKVLTTLALLILTNYSISFSQSPKPFDTTEYKRLEDSANINFENANYLVALKFADKAQQIIKETNQQCISTGLQRYIGHIWKRVGNYELALIEYKDLLHLCIKCDNYRELIIAQANIGRCYLELNQIDSAIRYEKLAIENIPKLYPESDIFNSAQALLVRAHSVKNDTLTTIAEAKIYFDSIHHDLNLGSDHELTHLSKAYLNIGKLDTALLLAKEVLFRTINNEALAVHQIQSSTILSSIYHQKNELDSAYKYLLIKFQIEKSVDLNKSLQDMMIHANSKRIENDSLQNVIEIERINVEHDQEIQKESERRTILLIGLGVSILFGIFAIYSYVRKRKSSRIIEKQKIDLEEKNKEILDSINYAKRIQSAILPPNKVVKEYLSESFILYKPKDVVAGDFYWMEQSKGKVFFAAADCTGHGVPGAMVSVVCNNALNRSVREYGLITPGSILDKTKELVIQEFEKSEEDVKDGMDIALCCLDGNNLTYAGAHNPLWIIRNGEIIEIKANKQPIGKFEFSQPFKTNEIELQKGDAIYLFSDGYPDQFGGENGKKYKTGNLKKFLLTIQAHSMDKQKELLTEEFEKWRGNMEQIDDVCVIGVKI